MPTIDFPTAANRVSDRLESWEDQAQNALETPLNWIRKNPWPALAGVVALGFWWATRTPSAAESVPQAPESPEKA
jgi:hypothetical protein